MRLNVFLLVFHISVKIGNRGNVQQVYSHLIYGSFHLVGHGKLLHISICRAPLLCSIY